MKDTVFLGPLHKSTTLDEGSLRNPTDHKHIQVSFQKRKPTLLHI